MLRRLFTIVALAASASATVTLQAPESPLQLQLPARQAPHLRSRNLQETIPVREECFLITSIVPGGGTNCSLGDFCFIQNVNLESLNQTNRLICTGEAQGTPFNITIIQTDPGAARCFKDYNDVEGSFYDPNVFDAVANPDSYCILSDLSIEFAGDGTMEYATNLAFVSQPQSKAGLLGTRFPLAVCTEQQSQQGGISLPGSETYCDSRQPFECSELSINGMACTGFCEMCTTVQQPDRAVQTFNCGNIDPTLEAACGQPFEGQYTTPFPVLIPYYQANPPPELADDIATEDPCSVLANAVNGTCTLEEYCTAANAALEDTETMTCETEGGGEITLYYTDSEELCYSTNPNNDVESDTFDATLPNSFCSSLSWTLIYNADGTLDAFEVTENLGADDSVTTILAVFLCSESEISLSLPGTDAYCQREATCLGVRVGDENCDTACTICAEGGEAKYTFECGNVSEDLVRTCETGFFDWVADSALPYLRGEGEEDGDGPGAGVVVNVEPTLAPTMTATTAATEAIESTLAPTMTATTAATEAIEPTPAPTMTKTEEDGDVTNSTTSDPVVEVPPLLGTNDTMATEEPGVDNGNITTNTSSTDEEPASTEKDPSEEDPAATTPDPPVVNDTTPEEGESNDNVDGEGSDEDQGAVPSSGRPVSTVAMSSISVVAISISQLLV